MRKIVTIEWKIYDTRNENGGYRTGISKLVMKAKDYVELMNAAIDFANDLPSWELKGHNINLEEYREGKICRYHYRTELSSILKIEDCK